MVDILTSEERSKRMRLIRARDTQPELAVRRLIHGLGYRYRIHVKALPGTPDIVFPARRKVIFVHGCFWHMHADCRDGRVPASRVEYWRPKLFRTRDRDEQHKTDLAVLGWEALVVWECELRDMSKVAEKITEFLETVRADQRPTHRKETKKA